MAKPKKRKRKERAERLHREPIVREVARLLDTGVPTKWRWESACRQGLRASMCFRGATWALADRRAEEIVQLAYHRIGISRRPSWFDGQPDPQDTEHTWCKACGGLLDDCDRSKPYCSDACGELWRARRHRAETKLGDGKKRRAALIVLTGGKSPDQPKAVEPRQRLCRHCREPFTAKRASRFYCSTSCLSSARRLDIRDCLVCANPFTAKVGLQKYCGPQCLQEAMRQAYRKAPNEKTCLHCDAPFKTVGSAVYCGKRCRDAAFRARNAAEIPPRPCGICNATFQPFNSLALYCSDACHDEGRRRTQRARNGRPAEPAQNCCLICEATFKGRALTQTTCGETCRAEMGRRRAAAHHKAKGQRLAA